MQSFAQVTIHQRDDLRYHRLCYLSDCIVSLFSSEAVQLSYSNMGDQILVVRLLI